jgi:hypothetical protein
MTDNDKDEPRDDVDWLKDAFERALQGDNGTVPDASRPAVNPFAGLTPTGDTAPIDPIVPPAVAEPVQSVTPVEPVESVETVLPSMPTDSNGHRHDLDLDFETENLPPVTAFEPVVPLENPLPSVATDYPPTEALDAVDLPAMAIPEPIAPAAPASAPVAPALSDETTGIDRLDALFSSSDTTANTSDTSAVTVPLAMAAVSGTSTPATTRTRESDPADQAKFRQALVMVVGVIVIAIVSIGAFLGGSLLGTPAAAPTAAPTAEPTGPTAIQPPGEYPFDQLFGGECLEPFVSPWEATFTVVDCATPHTAQLVYAGDLAVDESYPSYPGDSRIGQAAMAGCSRQGVLNMSAAEPYTDLQISAAYPPSSEAWDSGHTRYFCFASLSSGQPLTESVAGNLMTDGAEPTPESTASD